MRYVVIAFAGHDRQLKLYTHYFISLFKSPLTLPEIENLYWF
jgi:hypothetical protein